VWANHGGELGLSTLRGFPFSLVHYGIIPTDITTSDLPTRGCATRLRIFAPQHLLSTLTASGQVNGCALGCGSKAETIHIYVHRNRINLIPVLHILLRNAYEVRPRAG